MCIHQIAHECRMLTCVDVCLTCGFVLWDYRKATVEKR